MPKRIIRAISAHLNDGTEVLQGQEVDLSDDEVARFEASGTLVPEGFDSFAAYDTASMDAYRGGRGDTEAASRALSLRKEAASGGIIDHGIDGAPSENPYVEKLRSDAPTVDETVAMAEGDSDKAVQVLEAENLVTGQQPREGVVKGLNKIIERGGE